MSDVAERYATTVEPFGAWLIKQHQRSGLIGDLARAAKNDRRFPKEGTSDDVQKYLRSIQADGDTWAAFEDAEMDYTCL